MKKIINEDKAAQTGKAWNKLRVTKSWTVPREVSEGTSTNNSKFLRGNYVLESWLIYLDLHYFDPEKDIVAFPLVILVVFFHLSPKFNLPF